MENFDVVALGELLIDFTAGGVSDQGNPLFEANPGGAPCNVLSMLCKLGRKTAFIGKVGEDMFGRQLKEVAEGVGISMQALATTQKANTTLAFVQTLAGGERDFSFYRRPGADMLLEPADIPEKLISASKIFHFGSLSLTHEPARSATQKAIAVAKAAGAILSFDPNLRPPLWDDMEQAKEQIAWGLSQCDVLKIADNELIFMTNETDFDKGAAMLREQYPNIKLLCVTLGPDGSRAYYGDEIVPGPPIGEDNIIEKTGAGDTFCACVLNFVLEHGLDDLSKEKLTHMLRFANAASYLVTTRKGAIRSMPEREQVQALL